MRGKNVCRTYINIIISACNMEIKAALVLKEKLTHAMNL